MREKISAEQKLQDRRDNKSFNSLIKRAASLDALIPDGNNFSNNKINNMKRTTTPDELKRFDPNVPGSDQGNEEGDTDTATQEGDGDGGNTEE